MLLACKIFIVIELFYTHNPDDVISIINDFCLLKIIQIFVGIRTYTGKLRRVFVV